MLWILATILLPILLTPIQNATSITIPALRPSLKTPPLYPTAL